MTNHSFVLASASPRRRELLEQLGLRFEVCPQDVDERRQPDERPDEYVARLAREKAAAATRRDLPVLGADTIVVVDDEVLGKPADKDEAIRMLGMLSGRWHKVMTAVAVIHAGQQQAALSTSDVCFRQITRSERVAYWATGEPADKAGGYAIQGVGGMFVSELRGSYSGVVGLPVYETVNLLAGFGVQPLSV